MTPHFPHFRLPHHHPCPAAMLEKRSRKVLIAECQLEAPGDNGRSPILFTALTDASVLTELFTVWFE